MQEIELKFLVPKARLKGLMRQTKVKFSKQTHLSAYYYDTPTKHLARAGIGLRIRREGDKWVQTIKAGGDGIASRLEHNALLDCEHVQLMLADDTLRPDLTLYQGTSIEPILADFDLTKLTCQYVTDVMRTTRLLEDKQSQNQSDTANVIELAHDCGEIIDSTDNRRYPIQEIEFELISGELSFLFDTTKIWCKRYKLCLSTITKAERGGLLVKGQAHSPAIEADFTHYTIDKHISLPAFVRATVHHCLLQILPNSSAIVAGSLDDEHVLQLRIGIQRLQVALQSFKKFSEHLNPEWLPILKQTQTLLGDYRDLEKLRSCIEPILIKHGAPKVNWDRELDAIKIMPIDAVRANDFQLTLLELIAFTMSDTSAEPKANKLAIDKLSKILSKRHNTLLKAARKYQDISTTFNSRNDCSLNDLALHDEALNKVRRRVKELCYLSEFAAPLYSKKKTKRWLKCLSKVRNQTPFW